MITLGDCDHKIIMRLKLKKVKNKITVDIKAMNLVQSNEAEAHDEGLVHKSHKKRWCMVNKDS